MTLSVLAAGSLRAVWPKIAAAYGQAVTVKFGPAGLLCERIRQGERCDLFLSANIAHPHALLLAGYAFESGIFTHNELCLSIRERLATPERSWLDLLSDAALRIATSTPISDPSGDYTWQLFERIEQQHPGFGESLKQRALQLVGGPKSPTVPAGQSAASWLLNGDRADIFIGYQSYAAQPGIAVLAIPTPFQIRADYAFAVCNANARPLAAFLLSAQAQTILQKGGFLPLAPS